MSITDTELESMLSAARKAARKGWADLCAAQRATGAERVRPVDTGAGVSVIGCQSMLATREDAERLGLDTILAELADGSREPISITATADGRQVNRSEWHQGEASGDWVYYEVWQTGGMVAHGWCDPTSRKLLQTG